MRCMPLRACSVAGNELLEFSLQDGPKFVTDKKMVLSQRSGSPVLTSSSLSRGSGIYNEQGQMIYEGDYLLEHGFCVLYSQGFKCFKDNRFICNLCDLRYKGEIRTNPSFKARKGVNLYKNPFGPFQLQGVHLYTKNSLVVSHNKMRCVSHTDVQQYCGLRVGTLYFYLGDTVIMNNGIHGILDLLDGLLTVVSSCGEVVCISPRDYKHIKLGGAL